jgi:hypothetical protein
MDDYVRRITAATRAFCQPGDTVSYLTVRDAPGSECELCGKQGIRWVHAVRNARTGKELAIGNQCIGPFERIVGQCGDISFDMPAHPMNVDEPEWLNEMLTEMKAYQAESANMLIEIEEALKEFAEPI